MGPRVRPRACRIGDELKTVHGDILSALRAKAEKATPGPWQRSYYVPKKHGYDPMNVAATNGDAHEKRTIRGPGVVGTPECNIVLKVEYSEHMANLDFIAAANPASVIALLNYIDDLKASVYEHCGLCLPNDPCKAHAR